MEEENIAIKAAKELGVEKLLPEVYKDLLQPAAKEVGEGLLKVAKAVRIATAPFELTVWGYEQIREYLTSELTCRLSNVPPQEIIPPKLSVAGPIINNFPFVSDEPKLRALYAELLASAMTSNKQEKVHPSFSFIIQQLTSDEAVLLEYISSSKIRYGYLCDSKSDPDTGGLEGESIYEQFKQLCLKAGLTNTNMFASYCENLVRLKLFTHELLPTAQLVPEGAYHLEAAAYVKQVYRDTVVVSDYGQSFIDVCIENDT